MPVSRSDILNAFTDIASAYVSNPINRVDISELPKVLKIIQNEVLDLVGLKDLDAVPSPAMAAKPTEGPTTQAPAVDPNKSVFDDYIICLEDGRKYKVLKRHIQSRYGMSPEEYRRKWGLPADYPMVAPNYREKRASLARRAGFSTMHQKKKD
ncbi:hypothetical protein AD930_03595 [Acetobacter malorum]|nr:hypothetical protein AD930_03595 [Acetobacter malorum]